MTPVVTDCPYPSALPIAIALSPTVSELESPSVAMLIAERVSLDRSSSSTAITAISTEDSVPFR